MLEKGILTYAKRGADVGISSVVVSLCRTDIQTDRVLFTAEEGEAPRLHRRRPLRHVNQEESHVH